MYISDFTNSKSMHDYLLHLFLSETGIFGFDVSHQEVQYDALTIVAKDLKNKLMKDWKYNGFSVNECKDLTVSKNEEAILMLEVLSIVNTMNALGTSPVKIMQLGVYPKVTRMINGNQELKTVLKAGYDKLVNAYPDKEGRTIDSPPSS